MCYYREHNLFDNRFQEITSGVLGVDDIKRLMNKLQIDINAKDVTYLERVNCELGVKLIVKLGVNEDNIQIDMNRTSADYYHLSAIRKKVN